jgi:hypothetical protein
MNMKPRSQIKVLLVDQNHIYGDLTSHLKIWFFILTPLGVNGNVIPDPKNWLDVHAAWQTNLDWHTELTM